MKYDLDTGLREILRRSEVIKQKRKRKQLYLMTCSASVLMLTLILTIAGLSEAVVAETNRTVYGFFLLSSEAGGYVLVAVIAFTVGVILTLLTQKYRKGGKKGIENENAITRASK